MALVPLAGVDRTTLRWLRRTERPAAFALLAGESAVAELEWSRVDGSLASGRTADAAWTLKRIGFLHPRLTVRAAPGGPDVARVSIHLNYHRIELADGGAFRFHRAGLLVPAWKVSTEDGAELLHVEPVREGRRLVGGAVIASDAGARAPELPLLAIVSWYVIVLAWFEDEALVPFEGPDAPAGAG
ncbi:MAG TPA: hypothetical protein VEL82_07315 [Thermoplasmata archaeon]|nr:hypothetical protein [Thermoplasmata archaeon]